jgi:hypothetical protein
VVSAWDTLGIAATPEEGAIRKAYAARVRQWRPDTHPQEFARLREAYEQALRWARMAVQEQAQAQDEVEDAAPAPAPAPAPARILLPEPVAAPADLPLSAAVPGADALIRDLAQCFSQHGEFEAIRLLRQHYALVSAHTVDARLDWEQVLLASLLGAGTPPLSLLFEGDRLLGWRNRPADVTQMFGHEPAERLRLLIELAHETTYLRFFSTNRWQRRIFGAARLPWIGMTVQVEVARHSVDWWQKLALQAGRESLHELLDGRVLRRLAGLLVMSTDVLLALAIAWVCWHPVHELAAAQAPWIAPGLAAAVFALALPLPLLGRWLWNTPAARHVRRWRDALERVPFAVRAIGLAAVLVASIVALAADAPLPVRLAGGAVLFTLGAAIQVIVLAGVWYVLRFCEQLVSLPWLWLQRTWGLNALRGAVEGPAVPGWRDQLRALPPALAAAWRLRRARRMASAEQERLARAAQPAKKGQFNWWWILWGFVALQALVRLAK